MDGFLLRHTTDGGTIAYYRYTSSSERFAKVSSDDWDAEVGTDALCFVSVPIPPEFLAGKMGLRAALEELAGGPLAGSKFITAWFSPTNRFVAVLSAKHDFDATGMPFISVVSQQQSSRQHYHELLSAVEKRRLGVPLRIPLATAGAKARTGHRQRAPIRVGICWSPDEKYVLYADGTTVCVVPAE